MNRPDQSTRRHRQAVPGAAPAPDAEPEGAAAELACADGTDASGEHPPHPIDADPAGDTIVAVATPAGTGALAIVRVSGAGAIDCVDRLFRGASPLAAARTHTAHYGTIVEPDRGGDGPLDDVVATVFKRPSSYTGEDTVEITCHGSSLIAARIAGALLRAGARSAEPGEFTRRAYLNGRLDLAQAEAVADVIGAATDAALRGARNQLDGGLSAHVAELRQRVLECAALIELQLDFTEEDVELEPAAQLAVRIGEIGATVDRMLATYAAGRMLRDGVNVVLTGPPNVGKSSLLNRLARQARALVTDIPGTTRDVIREDLDLHGVYVRLHDTAGLRASTDLVEQLGVQRTLDTAGEADLVVLVTAADVTFPAADLERLRQLVPASRILVIANKSDLETDRPPPGAASAAAEPAASQAELAVSALTGAGIDALARLVVDRSVGTSYSERSAAVSNARHRDALLRAGESLAAARRGVLEAIGGELVAAELRAAVAHLEEIVGVVTSDDVLEQIFAKFCIGK